MDLSRSVYFDWCVISPISNAVEVCFVYVEVFLPISSWLAIVWHATTAPRAIV